jgi:hypothetical protein
MVPTPVDVSKTTAVTDLRDDGGQGILIIMSVAMTTTNIPDGTVLMCCACCRACACACRRRADGETVCADQWTG